MHASRRCRRGAAAIQSLMLIAVCAIILLGFKGMSQRAAFRSFELASAVLQGDATQGEATQGTSNPLPPRPVVLANPGDSDTGVDPTTDAPTEGSEGDSDSGYGLWDFAGDALTVAGDVFQAVEGTAAIGTSLLWGMFDDTAPAALLGYGWDQASTGYTNLWSSVFGGDRVESVGSQFLKDKIGGYLGSGLAFLYDFGAGAPAALKGGSALFDAWKAGRLDDISKLNADELAELQRAMDSDVPTRGPASTANDVVGIRGPVLEGLSRSQADKVRAALKQAGLDDADVLIKGADMPDGYFGMTLGDEGFVINRSIIDSPELAATLRHEIQHVLDRRRLGDPGAYGQVLEDAATAAERAK